MEPITPEAVAALLGRWAAGRGPLYRLLATRLRGLVEEGALAPGTRLPPDRTLAAHLAVGRGTVVAAYDLLREEGRLTRRQGSGTLVARPAAPAREHDDREPRVSRFLSLVEPPPGTLVLTCAAPDAPPPELRTAFAHAAERLAAVSDDIGYHPAGHPELREAVAAWFRSRGLPTAPGQILVTTGAQQALSLVVGSYVAPGDTVLAERPTYPGALALFSEASAVTRTVAVDDHGVDAAAYVREIEQTRPALAYLIPSIHNPTGAVLPALERRRIAEAAGTQRVTLVDDETLAGLGFDGTVPPPLAGYPGGEDILTVGSLSKVAWGGLRVGWLRAPVPVIDRLARAKTIGDLGTDIAGQLAARYLMDAPDGLLQWRRAELRERHAHLCSLLDRWLPDWTYRPARGGQTVWVRLPWGDAATFAQVALRHGVALLPGDALAPGEDGARHLRIPFLAPKETLDTAVDRLARAWSGYSGVDRGAAPLNAMVV